MAFFPFIIMTAAAPTRRTAATETGTTMSTEPVCDVAFFLKRDLSQASHAHAASVLTGGSSSETDFLQLCLAFFFSQLFFSGPFFEGVDQSPGGSPSRASQGGVFEAYPGLCP